MCYIKVVSRWFMCYINQDLLVTKVNNYKFLTNLKVSPIEITLGKKNVGLDFIDHYLILKMNFYFIWKMR